MDLPQLPWGLTWGAVGVVVLTVLTGAIGNFFGDRMSDALRGLRQRAARRRTSSRDQWSRYALWVNRRYRTVKLGFVDVPVELEAVYVPLQYEHEGRRIDIYRDIQHHLHTVILGGAGAGKSTILRHSMQQWAAAPEGFDRVPVLVELGRYDPGERTIQDLVVAGFGLVVTNETRRRRRKPSSSPLVDDAERAVSSALREGKLCLFLDGLDEVVTDQRAEVVRKIKEFAEQYETCQIVVTCREAVYDNDLGPTFDRTITVSGINDAGIRQFLRQWFTRRRAIAGQAECADIGGETEEPAPDPREQVEQLMAELRANPVLMRLSRSPLLLTMIAFLHDVDPGEGPMLSNSRAEFYEHAVEHLLRRDRRLGRDLRLGRFKWGDKLMALRAIALAAQGDLEPGSDHRIISRDEIKKVMNGLSTRFLIDETHLPRMVDEIVERSGLLIRLPDPAENYEFAHLTLQEYLAAVELAHQPERLLALYRENPARWRETVKLWCAAANRDVTDVVQQLFAGDERDRLLALECLAESRNVDPVQAGVVVNSFRTWLGVDMPDRDLVLSALGSVAGNPGPTGTALLHDLCTKAMWPGSIGGDAVVALAESRQRSAIETLSKLSEYEPSARAALRATGELAVPVLARRAARGSVTAVDDLAAVATPAAAVAIAEQLWAPNWVAARAAWHLAVLIHRADVEDELARFDPEPFRCGNSDWFTWLWRPFVAEQAARGGLAVVMGRVGWLIDKSHANDVPDRLAPVDARLALALGAGPGRFLHGDLPRNLQLQIKTAAIRAGRRTPFLFSDRPFFGREAEDALDAVRRVDSNEARRLADAVNGLALRDQQDTVGSEAVDL